jgi:Arylsulfotransferase (ASST)
MNDRFFLAALFALLILTLGIFVVQCSTGEDPDESSESADDDDNPPGDDDDDQAADDDDDASPFGCSEDFPDRTVGLRSCQTGAYDGYTLFSPLYSPVTYLIDMHGRLVHSWASEGTPAHAVYLLEDGTLLRTLKIENHPVFMDPGGAGGQVQILAWNGDKLWDYQYSGDDHLLHHDVAMLPNGNVLMIAWKARTEAEALAAGRDSVSVNELGMYVTHLIEVERTGPESGNIVWEWDVWDHLIQDLDPCKENYGTVADHPELADINYGTNPAPDWTHTNAINYNAELDQIVISVRFFHEIWVIDHSTTTAEAAGHTGGNSGKGGDLLYRWGNPQAYQAGDANDQRLFYQHDSQWIAAGLPGEGNILVFNNGYQRPAGHHSSVDELIAPRDENDQYIFPPGSSYGPEELVWTYQDPGNFYSDFISGAQRLPNGNTLICEGASGRFFEVTSDKEIIWEYINPVANGDPLRQGDPVQDNQVFRTHRYPPDYSGFDGRDLTPGDVIELPAES